MKDNRIKETFSKIQAPESVLREVNMKISEIESNNTFARPRLYGKIIPIALVLDLTTVLHHPLHFL